MRHALKYFVMCGVWRLHHNSTLMLGNSRPHLYCEIMSSTRKSAEKRFTFNHIFWEFFRFLMTYVVIPMGFLQVERLFNSVNTPQEEHSLLTVPQIVL